MKLSDALAAYYEQSGKASEVARSLAFAGIAIVWTFKVGEGASSQVAADFIAPAFFLIVTLVLDFSQYTFAALVWGFFHRYHENKQSEPNGNAEVSAPGWLNWPALICFWLKLVSIAAAYGFLLRSVLRRWS